MNINLGNKGFTLVELLVVIAIIGILSGIVFAILGPTRDKAKDSRRKLEISQFGKFLALGCYLPDGGPGTYDIADIASELKIKSPKYADLIKSVPMDPSVGNQTETFYKYQVTAGGVNCVLYANLEVDSTEITLPALSDPTPGVGTGVLEASSPGWNGTTKYFQVGY